MRADCMQVTAVSRPHLNISSVSYLNVSNSPSSGLFSLEDKAGLFSAPCLPVSRWRQSLERGRYFRPGGEETLWVPGKKEIRRERAPELSYRETLSPACYVCANCVPTATVFTSVLSGLPLPHLRGEAFWDIPLPPRYPRHALYDLCYLEIFYWSGESRVSPV